MRNRLAIVPTLLALMTSSAVGAGNTAPTQSAKVFEQVCVDGEGQFADGEIAPVEAGEIPTRARSVLMIGLWYEEWNIRARSFVKESEMPAQLFEIAANETLYLGVPDERPTNPVQASCLVLVKGDEFDTLSNYAATLTSAESPEANIPLFMIQFPYSGHVVTVSKHNRRGGQQWTMIASSPTAQTYD